jgi:hypothetical protein
VRKAVLIIIDSDPRLSPRPAEAVRFAAGLAQCPRIEVTLHLREAAVLALGGDSDHLVDADNFPNYLPLLVRPGQPVFVQAGAPARFDLQRPPIPFAEMDEEQLAREIARSHAVIRF